MRRIEAILTRLPDVDGKVNFRIEYQKEQPHCMVRWDYDEIREDVAKMKRGESKIINN